MTQQGQLSLAIARELGEQGMQRVTERAERVSPGISDLMYAYLVKFAIERKRSERFTSEVVTMGYAADPGFEQPTDARAWGPVFQRAINQGVLSIADYNGVRKLGHGVKGAKRYRSLACGRKWTEFEWKERG